MTDQTISSKAEISANGRIIPDGWIETTLSEVLFPVSDTYILKDKEEIHFLNTGDILDGKLLHFESIPIDKLPGQAKKRFQKGDILFSEIRPANKRYMLVNFECIDSVASTKLMVLRTKANVDVNYIYKLITSNNVIDEFQLIAESRSGTFPQITFESIAYFPVFLPPLPEQKAIAAVLSSLDDKIKLLRAQNKTLEKIAQTLFKHWFIDFEFPNEEGRPYKSSGGKMINSELGQIPVGWKVGKIGDFVDLRGGTTPSTNNVEFWNGDIAWSSPKDISNINETFLLTTEKKITKKGLDKISSGLLPRGTLLLSSRAPIGYLAISNLEIAINQGYISFLPNQYFSNYYIYLWLKVNMQIITNMANGSTFLEISKTSLKNILSVIPNYRILEVFNEIIEPVFEKNLINMIQIRTIARLRNMILPKIITGKMRVNNIEKIEHGIQDE